MEIVIRDGLQNGSWVTRTIRKLNRFLKKDALVLKNFSSIKSKNKNQEAEEGRHRGEHLGRGAQ